MASSQPPRLHGSLALGSRSPTSGPAPFLLLTPDWSTGLNPPTCYYSRTTLTQGQLAPPSGAHLDAFAPPSPGLVSASALIGFFRCQSSIPGLHPPPPTPLCPSSASKHCQNSPALSRCLEENATGGKQRRHNASTASATPLDSLPAALALRSSRCSQRN